VLGEPDVLNSITLAQGGKWEDRTAGAAGRDGPVAAADWQI
jgi:hypothetical protein